MEQHPSLGAAERRRPAPSRAASSGRPPRRARAGLALAISLIVLAAEGRSQILVDGERPLDATLVLALPKTAWPALLRIEARLSAEGEAEAAEARITLRGRARGPLSRFEIATRRYAAAFPLPLADEPGECVIEPTGKGLGITSVSLLPAALLEVEVQDEATRKPVPALVRVVAMDGQDPPLYGFPPEEDAAGSAVFATAGRCEILVPAAASVSLVATSHPLRGLARRTVVARAGSRTGVKFLLPPDLLPPGAMVLEAPLPPAFDFDARSRLDRVLGIGRRVADPVALDAEAAYDVPDALVARLLDREAKPALLSDMPNPARVPRSLRPLRSVRFLGNDRLCHTNGPLIIDEGLRRRELPGRVLLEGRLGIVAGVDAVLRTLSIRTADGEQRRYPLDGATTSVPFAVTVPADRAVVAVVEGASFRGDPPGVVRPFAVRRID